MADEPFRIQVEITPARVRDAAKQVLRMQAAGVGVKDAGAAPVFFGEATRAAMSLLGDLEFGEDTSDETLNELANRVAHLLHASTLVGFQALLILEHERGELDYPAVLAEIEAEIAQAYPDEPG